MQKKCTGQILPQSDGSDKENSSRVEVELKVMTFNCWGLWAVSSRRKERMAAIGHAIADLDLDVIFLQEVWVGEDFENLRSTVESRYPYSHYFDQGIIGSGTGILTKYRISNAYYHEFSMNGYPLKFWHGDWFAAKGIGACQMDIDGLSVTVFESHYHAEYDPKNDIYLGHRVIHALESAQWLNMVAASTDLILYCGDFNTDPDSVPYKLLRYIVPLNDAWADYKGDVSGGETCDFPENTYSIAANAPGKRIDYIMYRAGPGFEATTVNFWFPLDTRVPDQNFSYSDHEAVAAIIKVTKTGSFEGGLRFRRSLSMANRSERVSAVNSAISIIDSSLRQVDSDQCKYTAYTTVLFVLLGLTFVPSAYINRHFYLAVDLSLFLPRFVMTVFIVVFALMASLFNKKERNALRSAAKELKLIRDQE